MLAKKEETSRRKLTVPAYKYIPLTYTLRCAWRNILFGKVEPGLRGACSDRIDVYAGSPRRATTELPTEAFAGIPVDTRHRQGAFVKA